LPLSVTDNGSQSSVVLVAATFVVVVAGIMTAGPWLTIVVGKAMNGLRGSTTLLAAGCSLTVSIAGGLVERKRPFALLRLAGAQPGTLRRVVMAETTGPLLTTVLLSAGLGLTLAAIVVTANQPHGSRPTPPTGSRSAAGHCSPSRCQAPPPYRC
jgi:hypothetical protein